MKKIQAETKIKATAEQVWSIITNFDDYPHWNPFIKTIEGQPEKGQTLKVMVAPPGARGMQFRPVVTEYLENRELAWLGKALVGGLFDGEHRLRIEPVGPGEVKFIQAESFRGLLVPLFGSLVAKTQTGFHWMNRALKKKAEKPKAAKV